MMEPNNDSDNPSEQPKKRRKTPKKRKLSKSDKDDALKALSGFFDTPERTKRSKDAKALHGHIGEYLSSYIVIGYTVTGVPVATTYASNQRDLDALNTSLQKFIMDSYARHNFPPGSFE